MKYSCVHFYMSDKMLASIMISDDSKTISFLNMKDIVPESLYLKEGGEVLINKLVHITRDQWDNRDEECLAGATNDLVEGLTRPELMVNFGGVFQLTRNHLLGEIGDGQGVIFGRISSVTKDKDESDGVTVRVQMDKWYL